MKKNIDPTQWAAMEDIYKDAHGTEAVAIKLSQKSMERAIAKRKQLFSAIESKPAMKKKNPAAVALGKLSAKSMTKEQRIAIAKKAALARWGKRDGR